jgi:hypothetical protein
MDRISRQSEINARLIKCFIWFLLSLILQLSLFILGNLHWLQGVPIHPVFMIQLFPSGSYSDAPTKGQTGFQMHVDSKILLNCPVKRGHPLIRKYQVYIQWCLPHNEKILNPIGNIFNVLYKHKWTEYLVNRK